MSDSLKEIKEPDFNSLIKEKRDLVAEFGAPWCGACKLMEPVLSSLQDNFKDIDFVKIDVGKSPGLASKMGVMSLPNILLIKKGKVIDQIIGAANKKSLQEKINKLK